MSFKIDDLKEKEIKIYYGVKSYPKLIEDAMGNYVVLLDTTTVFYTSTPFNKIKNHRNIFCFKNKKDRCYYEDSELETDGFVINVYSNFTSDSTNKTPYKVHYEKILIERIK